MPNGDPHFDFQDMEWFFAPIADAIGKFASQRNLLITKYYHDGRDWSLQFNHPKGGQASVILRRDGKDRLRLSSCWHFDDFDRFTRYIRWYAERDISIDPTVVSHELNVEFNKVVSERFGNWNQVQGGYENVWGRYSRDEFLSMALKLPNPIIVG